LYVFDTVQGLTEARDATTGDLVGSGRVPSDFASVEERFAVAGDLWFEVGRNTTGHIEAPPEPITISQSGYAARLSSSVFLNCNSNSMGLT
jgi:hypothetical protein